MAAPNFLKSMRRRFGISAPRMTVRTHVAWYWRWLGISVVAAVTLAMAAWMYDAGRRFAGFDQSEIVEELTRLRSSVSKMEIESKRLRAESHASEARLKIEQSAQQQLTLRVRQLVGENTRLKEDLAFFEGLMPNEQRLESVTIHRFKVDAGPMSGEYHYRLLFTQGGKRTKEYQGAIKILIDLQYQGRNDIIVATGRDIGADGLRKLNFKFFRRVEGSFRVPSGAKVRAVQVKVYKKGSTDASVTKSVKLG